MYCSHDHDVVERINKKLSKMQSPVYIDDIVDWEATLVPSDTEFPVEISTKILKAMVREEYNRWVKEI